MSSPYAEEKQWRNCATDMRKMKAMKECGRQMKQIGEKVADGWTLLQQHGLGLVAAEERSPA
jgi:hypothetical protein